MSKTNPRVWMVLMQELDSMPHYLLGRRGPECKNPGQWGFFGGNVDPGETEGEAVARELLEETGIPMQIFLPDRPRLLFRDLVGQKPCTWCGLMLSGQNLQRALANIQTTKEVVDYEWVRADLVIPDMIYHYSVSHYFQWLHVQRSQRGYESDLRIVTDVMEGK